VLDIGKLGVDGEAYYLEHVASGAEDYYLHAGEAPGVWLGSAAGERGLIGRVEAEALRAVLRAIDPASGVGLGPSPARTVPGFDLTFRAPKSVSVLWGLADPAVADEVRRAHDAAVLAAVAYWEGQGAGRGGVRRAGRRCGCRGSSRRGLGIARRGRAIRCCTPTWWSPTSGAPWTAARCTRTERRPGSCTRRLCGMS
jgi:hypothetical protein